MATVRYLVNNVDESLPFYLALGFVETERRGPPFAMLARGDLELWPSGPGTSASRPLPDGSVPSPGGWNRFVIDIDDLSAAMDALRPTGARFRSSPVKGPGGVQVLAEDPSGNPIELFEAVGDSARRGVTRSCAAASSPGTAARGCRDRRAIPGALPDATPPGYASRSTTHRRRK